MYERICLTVGVLVQVMHFLVEMWDRQRKGGRGA
jgi:hypothetical protein